MSTITTRAGKGSPLTNNEVDANFTNLNTDKAELSGAAFTGNITFTDNSKAIFGAGSDLQIYHDGSNSWVKDSGDGVLALASNGNGVGLYNADGTKPMVFGTVDSDVKIYHNGLLKLATTASGIDVTGTVTADGLTVNSGGTSSSLSIRNGSNNSFLNIYSDLNGVALLDVDGNNVGANPRFQIDLGNVQTFRITEGGDISFYEDTGTTPKFFWDASAESLGIGISSPSTRLEVGGGGGSETIKVSAGAGWADVRLHSDATNGGSIYFNDGADAGQLFYYHVDDSMRFHTATAERMRIDSSGNVKIGDSATDITSKLVVSGNGDANVATFMYDGAAGTYLDFVLGGANGAVTLAADARSGAYPPLVFKTGATERMRIDSSGRVGIGIVPETWNTSFIPMQLGNSGYIYGRSAQTAMEIGNNAYFGGSGWAYTTTNTAQRYIQDSTDNAHKWFNAASGTADTSLSWSERMRIDSSGNLLVGTTSTIPFTFSSGSGAGITSGGTIMAGATAEAGLFNRVGSDGAIIQLYKAGTAVGNIAAKDGDIAIGTGDTGFRFIDGSDAISPHNISTNAGRDASISLGTSGGRFKDLYLSGGVYLGGTGAANKLDDYEEGTWTPANGGSLVINSIVNARYTKVGDVVTATAWLKTNPASTSFIINGLPFSSAGRSAASLSDVSNAITISNQVVGTQIYGYGGSTSGTNNDFFLSVTYHV